MIYTERLGNYSNHYLVVFWNWYNIRFNAKQYYYISNIEILQKMFFPFEESTKLTNSSSLLAQLAQNPHLHTEIPNVSVIF